MNILPIVIMVAILVGVTIILAVADFFLADNKVKKIIINNEVNIEVSGDGNLLDHLSNNKIFIPSACGGKGTCGHCKVQVTNGGGDVLPTEKAYLKTEEIDKGIRLACQVKVRDDIEVSFPKELLNAREYVGKVLEITDLTSDIKFIRIQMPIGETMDFKPGQYAQIRVPGYDVFRAYSIASPPSQKDTIDFIIKLIKNGLCTTYIHKALDVGDKISFTGPFGEFYLREDSEKEIICMARSCGMAPIRSILSHLKEQGMKRKVTYFFGSSFVDDIFMTDELTELAKNYPNFRYIPAVSRPKDKTCWSGEVGRVTELVEKYFGSLENVEAYLCGPAVMLDEATKVFIKKGMEPASIMYDEF